MQDLQSELERLKATVLSSAQQNGPLDDDQVTALLLFNCPADGSLADVTLFSSRAYLSSVVI